MTYTPHADHIDQLIRFMEVLVKLDVDQRQVFIDGLEKIVNPPQIIETHSLRFS